MCIYIYISPILLNCSDNIIVIRSTLYAPRIILAVMQLPFIKCQKAHRYIHVKDISCVGWLSNSSLILARRSFLKLTNSLQFLSSFLKLFQHIGPLNENACQPLSVQKLGVFILFVKHVVLTLLSTLQNIIQASLVFFIYIFLAQAFSVLSCVSTNRWKVVDAQGRCVMFSMHK